MLGGEHGEQGSDDARAVDHGSFADVISLQGQGSVAAPLVPLPQASHAHRLHQRVVCFQVVVCISGLASNAAINGEAEHSGSDGAPLPLGQGHGGEVVGQDVGAGHGLFADVVSIGLRRWVATHAVPPLHLAHC